MTSKRTLERRLNDLDPSGGDGPDEIVFTDYVVGSDWEPNDEDSEYEHADLAPGESTPVSRLRCWRDESGEWNSERTEL